MNDLISMAAAVECAIDAVDDWDGGWNPNRETVIRKYFAEVPAVDAAPVVHARWIETTIPANTTGHGGIGQDKKKGELCSACRCAFDAKMLWCDNYCPNCGAKMDGDADG